MEDEHRTVCASLFKEAVVNVSKMGRVLDCLKASVAYANFAVKQAPDEASNAAALLEQHLARIPLDLASSNECNLLTAAAELQMWLENANLTPDPSFETVVYVNTSQTVADLEMKKVSGQRRSFSALIEGSRSGISASMNRMRRFKSGLLDMNFEEESASVDSGHMSGDRERARAQKCAEPASPSPQNESKSKKKKVRLSRSMFFDVRETELIE